MATPDETRSERQSNALQNYLGNFTSCSANLGGGGATGSWQQVYQGTPMQHPNAWILTVSLFLALVFSAMPAGSWSSREYQAESPDHAEVA
jgi:hypothetical protein